MVGRRLCRTAGPWAKIHEEEATPDDGEYSSEGDSSSGDENYSSGDSSSDSSASDGQDASSQVCEDPNEQKVQVDWSQFPTISLYAQFESEEELLQYLGVDTSTLQSDADVPVA
jgi:hypothetical protein